MGKNYLQHELGGKTQGLKFNLGTLKHLGEQTKEDPLTFSVSNDINGQIKDVATIIYAGLLSNYNSKKLEQDFTMEDVIRWTEDLDMQEALTIVDAFREAYKVASPEGGADTREQAADMAAVA